MEEEKLSLYISGSKDGEMLFTPQGKRKLPALGILREITKAFAPFKSWTPPENYIGALMGQIVKRLVGDDLPEKFYAWPVELPPLLEALPEAIIPAQAIMPGLALEILALMQGAEGWLIPNPNPSRRPRYLRPKDAFLNMSSPQLKEEEVWDNPRAFRTWTVSLPLNKSVPLVVFGCRTKQVGQEILIVKKEGRKHLGYLYTAPSILALAWAEILWALENDVYARTCEICGGLFTLTPPYTQRVCPKEYDPECVKAWRAKVGIGGKPLWEYNREAQRRSREERARRKKSRPSKA